LAHELARREFSVQVVTGYPRHYVEQKDLDSKYGRGLYMVEQDGALEIVRVRRPRLPLHIPLFRGLDHLLQPLLFAGAVLLRRPSPAVLIYPSPPLTHFLVATLARWLLGTRVVMNLQDIFPQYAVALGVMRNRAMIACWEAVEELAYRNANSIVVHSPGNGGW